MPGIARTQLVQIDFDQFKVRNSNPREAFESLCYFLFCRRYKLPAGAFRYKNQTGIESNPLRRGRYVIGFQSKFFEHAIDYNELLSSITKSKGKHPKLNKIIFYVNKEFSESSLRTTLVSQQQQNLENEATGLGVRIEWVVPSNFEILLNQPTNFDLGQLYFGQTNEFEFIKNGVNPEIQTFLQSDECLNLPLSYKDAVVKSTPNNILRRSQKSFLIIGHPGSGKSIFVHFLFRVFSGLDKPTENQMLNTLVRQGAVPMIINLKDCIGESLENLIRARQNDSGVRGRSLGFIFLLDGLDELSDEKADQALSFIKELEHYEHTKKIIISCRSGNANRIKALVYLPNIIEYKFCDLDTPFIEQYFSKKADKSKSKLLKQLQKTNPKLLDDIKDVLLIRLLWETIKEINPDNTVVDLIQKKVNLLLNDPQHKKNIDSLNLLDLKPNSIIYLNQEISFRFYQKFQYRFSRKELQDIILATFPRLDYKSTNELTNYLSNIFFENTYSETDSDLEAGLIYQHRRYQEFFFTQRLKSKYEQHPGILRALDILSNRDFFEDYFLPFLRSDYEKREYIIGLLDLNLLDVYLGKHTGYGADDAYYLNSNEFVPSLANQNPYLIDELLESENFRLNKVLFVDIEILKTKFKEWEENPRSYRTESYLSSTWSQGVSSILKNIVVFWKAGNKRIVNKLMENLNEVDRIYKEKEYIKRVDKNQHIQDPFWQEWQSYLFILIRIRQKNIKNIFRDLVRGNYEFFPDEPEQFSRKKEGKEKLIKSFLTTVLGYKPNVVFSMIEQFEDFELINLLDLLCSYDFLNLFISSERLQNKVRMLLLERSYTLNENRLCIAFLKAYLNIPFVNEEKKFLDETLRKFRNERRVDWHFKDIPFKFALVSFALQINDFDSLNNPKDNLKYYDELELYAALFNSFVHLINKKISIGKITRNYIHYVQSHDDRLGIYLKVEISFLWAKIFSTSDTLVTSDLIILKERLLHEEFKIVPYSFYYKLSDLNQILFNRIVNESDLVPFEEDLNKAEDYQSLVNECFSLASFYSEINPEKSRLFFVKGLKESILRHGWRKDGLVSYQLVDCLEILWRNNWEPKDTLVKLSREVFNLTLRVGEFTDGKGTWRGPYNVIDLVAKYDIKLAEIFKKELTEKRGYSNVNYGAITGVLLGKVRYGFSMEEIEEQMREYRKRYDSESKPFSESFEQKIIVYIAIAESDLYTEEEKEYAFNKAYDLVEEMKKEEVSYYLSDTYFKNLKLKYLILCDKYNKAPNVELEKTEDVSEIDIVPESNIIQEISSIITKAKLNKLYKKIADYKQGYVLSKKETWEVLLVKTYEVLGNIQPFIKLLREASFPHTDFYTKNSNYFHLGLAVALSDINMRNEATKLLYRNTGHGGFVNVMKTYEVIKEKEMCKKLFYRYLQLCHFLSD